MPTPTRNSTTSKTGQGTTAAKSRPAASPVRKPPASKPAASKAAPARRSPKRNGPHLSFAVPPHLQREMVGVGLFVAAILIALSLRSASDVGLIAGVGGALQGVFGVAAWGVPMALAAAAAMLFVAGVRRIDRIRWEVPLGLLLTLGAMVGLIHLHLTTGDKLQAAEDHLGGGFMGYYISTMTSTIAGAAGATVILVALALIGLMLTFHISLGEIGRLLGQGGNSLIHLFTAGPTSSGKTPVIVAPDRSKAGVPTAKQRPVPAPTPLPARPPAHDDSDGVPLDLRINAGRKSSPAAQMPRPTPAPESNVRIMGGVPNANAADRGLREAATPAATGATPATPPAGPTVNGLSPLRSGAELNKQLNLPVAGITGMLWKLPEIGLLERSSEIEINDRDLRDKAKKIQDSLATFGVVASVREINSGPTVTQFALEPGEGVRVARIAALSNDLALALAAPSLRIEAPIPGMSRVGIEVPNTTPGMVGLRNIMESDFYRAGKGKMRIPVGRDTHGQPVVVDLTKLPHLLIAGATGSGKSVAINALIVSLLMQHTPDEVRFLMIDPKRVELSGFNGIPHLLRPVVTEMKPDREANKKGPREITAIEVLKWLLWEMERRYRLFARGTKDKEGITKIYRNIEQYHIAARASDGVMEPLPYIVLLIDELADLMLVAPEDVETAICRLAQLARATGIHLIIATQRPSVDVVTGLIKANFPARLAFAVTSMIDSRVILDTPGAEKLLGRGDALYTASDEAKPIRVQGTFVSDKEAEKVIAFWRTQMGQLPAPAPRLVPTAADGATPANGAAPTPALPSDMPEPDWLKALDSGESLDGGSDEDDEDAMLKEGIALVKRHKYASTSMLQRRLRIGYNRAARMIEKMEEMGIVGPGDGARPREVLVKDDEANPVVG
jgi:S-DNA-T family DNA segregation ATPase FtsK/SpoIIIE